MLANDEWKFDVVPEIMDGKNIADFIDPDIMHKLEELEKEEEERAAEMGEQMSEEVNDFPKQVAFSHSATFFFLPVLRS
jgi:nucleolar GTP-binding protein